VTRKGGAKPFVLPDVLEDGLVTILCGSAAGRYSAKRGLPYAWPQNRFWTTLWMTGLTKERLAPSEFHRLAEYRVGLTDLNKTGFGADADLDPADDDVEAFLGKLRRYRPRLVGFSAKRPAQAVFRAVFKEGALPYGVQKRRLEGAEVFVLPSPSGLAIRWWDPRPWRALACRHNCLALEPVQASAAEVL